MEQYQVFDTMRRKLFLGGKTGSLASKVLFLTKDTGKQGTIQAVLEPVLSLF